MRAVVLRSHGGPESLTIEEVPDPVGGPEDVIVRVRATALNRADLLQAMGMYPNPRPAALEIPGLEFAGTVQSIGAQVTMWKPGDEVMGIEAGGGYAELIATHERQLMKVPSSVGVADAAAIPEVFLTAWDALVVQGRLSSGRWALVHAGASGVGTASIQISKAISARIAVTSSSGKMGLCRSLGADLVFERSPSDWLTEAMEAVPNGFDTILDVIGGEEIDRNLTAVAMKGRILQVGMMGGSAAAVNAYALMGRRASWIGTLLRARPIEEKIALTRQFAAEMLPLFDEGKLKPVIDSRYPFDQIADAHRHMAANANAGKILIDVG
ncbi:MAG: NAD(P)H-quinone oxidoreductase [Ilumatobacteraceae bacterium]